MANTDVNGPEFRQKLQQFMLSARNLDRDGRAAMLYIIDHFQHTIADMCQAAVSAPAPEAAAPVTVVPVVAPVILEALRIAQGELTEVVAEAAKAANDITTAAQTVEKLSRRSHPLVQSDQVKAATQIFEACAFQDITGQRITKVVSTLKELHAALSDPASLDGSKLINAAQGKWDAGKSADGSSMLGGPQLGGDRPTQADVDDLFNAA